MQQGSMNLLDFQNKFSTEEACQEHLFNMRWPNGYRCPRCDHNEAYFHQSRHLHQCKKCGYQASLTAGTIFHKTRTPLVKWFWMIFLMGQHKNGIAMTTLKRMLNIKSYNTVWAMGQKIRKAMGERDAHYELAGIMEIDDTYFGSPKPGKRGRGAAGKAKVVVAVEIHEDKPRFATMQQVESMSEDDICKAINGRLGEDVIARTDGWKSYGFLNSGGREHQPIVVGSGKNAGKLLPWVHILISNIKGNIRGTYHGVSSKHLSRYLSEFCYRFNRRFWDSQMFDRLLYACINCRTITFSELNK